MRKILLVCNAGMSTSLLVVNMEKSAKEQGMQLLIKAVPLSLADSEINTGEWEVVMLGPQIRYELKRLRKEFGERIPIEVIDMRDYGMMNGKNVLTRALMLIEK